MHRLSNILPDFAFILPIEQVLPAHPFGHDKLQGRLAGWAGETTEELQEWFQLWVNQVSEHHNQGLQQEEGSIRCALLNSWKRFTKYLSNWVSCRMEAGFTNPKTKRKYNHLQDSATKAGNNLLQVNTSI